MIKKFEEYISEGFWKDGIKRAKSDDVRIEDKFNEDDVRMFKDVRIARFNQWLNEHPEFDEFTQNLFNDLLDFYEEHITKYIEKFGYKGVLFIWNNRIEEDHESLNLPTFDKTYKIKGSKKYKIHVTYSGDKKSYKVTVGDTGDEYNITNTKLSSEIFKNIISKLVNFILDDNNDLAISNLEINFDEFADKTKSNIIYKFCLYFSMFKKILPYDKYSKPQYDFATGDNNAERICKLFFIEKLRNDYVEIKVNDCEPKDITNTEVGQKILDFIKECFNEAKEKYIKDNGL